MGQRLNAPRWGAIAVGFVGCCMLVGDARAETLPCVGDVKNCGDPAVYARCAPQQKQCDDYARTQWGASVSAPGTVDDNLYVHAKPQSVKGGAKLGTQPRENAFNAARVHRNYGISAAPATHTPGQATQKAPGSGALPANSRRQGIENPPKHAHSSTHNTWAALETKARIDALQTSIGPITPLRMPGAPVAPVAPVVDPNLAAQYKRHHAGASDMQVASCEDYVYNKYYDEERWLDAIYRCAGDTRCETSVSLMTTAPGIAGRELHEMNEPLTGGVGPKIPGSSGDFARSAEMSGTLPRNGFFATGFFLPDSLVKAFAADPTKQAQVQALVDVVRRGFTSYQLKSPVAGGAKLGAHTQGFKDEWDFHRTMLARTAANKRGEFREYRQREDAVLGAMSAFYTQAACAASAPGCAPNLPSAVGVLGAHTQPWEQDPFVARAVYGNVDRANATNMGAFFQARPALKAAYEEGVNPGGGLSFAGLKGHAPVATQATLTTGSLAGEVFSPGVDSAPSPYLETQWASHPPKVDTSVNYARLDCGPLAPVLPMQLRAAGASAIGASIHDMKAAPQAVRQNYERFTGDYAACLAVNQVLDEWARQSSAPSCFDPNNFACDWSPRDFVTRWVNNYVNYQGDKKEKAFQFCKENQAIFSRRSPYTSAKAALDFIEEKLKEERKAIGKTPVLTTDTFGQQKSNHEVFGNDTIGAGYDYDFDWEVKVLKWFGNDNETKKLRGSPCDFGGHVKGSFDAYVYAFGSDDDRLVDASVSLKANDGGSGVGHFDGHLNFLGSEVFSATPNNVTINQSHSVSILNRWEREGHEWELLDIPFWVAWVKVEVRVDVAWHYGADASADVRVSEKKLCDGKSAKDVFFRLTGKFTPETDLDFIATATASVAGVVGVQLEVDLTLLHLALPIHTAAKAEVHGDNDIPSLTLGESLDMRVHAFDGSVHFYITGPFDARLFGWEVGSWEGSAYSPSLFRGSTHPIFLGDIFKGFN